MKQNLTLEALRQLLERRDMCALRDALTQTHPADLAELLESRGIHISRRAVAKYREEMGIKGSFERRQ